MTLVVVIRNVNSSLSPALRHIRGIVQRSMPSGGQSSAARKKDRQTESLECV